MIRKTKKIIIFVAIIAVAAALYFTSRGRKANDNNARINAIGPTTQNQPETTKTPEPENKIEPKKEQPIPEEAPPSKEIPEKYLLDMPFYSQAPLSKWDAFHEDMCEEASILNAGLYLEGKKLTKDQFESELQKIQKTEKKEIGEWKSTTVAQTKKLVDAYFEGKIKSKIIDSPTIEQIESEIAQNNPVIVPLAGRDIGNPNFTPPGPVYHMLVVKGYDSQDFITNDVGTRKGNSYAYKKEVIMKNIHDWNKKDIHSGSKKVLVLYK
ncbi:MAG: C39 family peptidase [Candidatus Moranbacteria bacterium]|nr:C39 family peptidase [Candidatus Moranbacteria bacterium]